MKHPLRIIAAGLALSSCASLPTPVTVLSSSETSTPEAIGSPAIWSGGATQRRPGPVGEGFIATLRPGGGIAVNDPTGVTTGNVDGPALTDLDVAILPLETSFTVVVAGVRHVRGRGRLVLHRMDPADQTLRPWAEIPLDLGRPNGFCMRQVADRLTAVVFDRRGQVLVLTLAEGDDGAPVVQVERRFHLVGVGHGCAIDTLRQTVFLSHARQGFWRARLVGEAAPLRLIDNQQRRTPRSLGVAFLTGAEGPYLTTLDQDRTAFSVWKIDRDELGWIGRFEVRERPGGRTARSLGGIDAYSSGFGAFDDGVVVVQDQRNDGSPNLKYVDWAEVRRALGF